MGAGLGRDHRLEAFAGIAADNAVDLAGRAAAGLFEHRTAFSHSGLGEAGAREEGLLVIRQALPLGGDVGR